MGISYFMIVLPIQFIIGLFLFLVGLVLLIIVKIVEMKNKHKMPIKYEDAGNEKWYVKYHFDLKTGEVEEIRPKK